MDKKKSSRTKRSKVESTNNKMNNVKQDQVKDMKQGETTLNKKGYEKVHDENTERSESNKEKTPKDISLLNVNEDKKINPGYKVLEAIPSTHKSNKEVKESSNERSNKKKKKKTKYLLANDEDKKFNNGDNEFEAIPPRRNGNENCNKSFCEDQKNSRNNCKKDSEQKNKLHDRNNTDFSENKLKSIDYSKGLCAVKSKDQNLLSNESFHKKPYSNKNAKHNNGISDKDSIDYNYKPNRAHNRKKSNFPDYGESVLEEINEDIFTLPNEYSLAHCVAEDLRMSAGIAVDFKNKFGGVGKLIDQDLKIGNVGIVKRHEQFAFYLITKKNSNGKPTMITMEKALRSLLIKMKEHNLTKLAIPKIGCGLDRLDWSEVTLLIKQIFSESGIHITVCVPSKILDAKASSRLSIYITPSNLWEMEPYTHIIIFICIEKVYKKNWTTDIVDKVDAKYPFKENLLKDVRNNKKLKPGDIKTYNVRNEVIICMFTTQTAYYSSLEEGLINIKLQTVKKYKFMAIQSGPIDLGDNFQHISWTVLIWRSIFKNSELWLCGDPKQKHKTVYDQYCKDLFGPMNNSFSSFQHNSPSQMDRKYNDNHLSPSSKDTNNQH